MDLNEINDDNLNYITIIQQKEEKRDLMFTALNFCAKIKYGENKKDYDRFISNLNNENYLISNIDNLLKTSMFLICVCECDDQDFEYRKKIFMNDTVGLKKQTPTLFQFRVFFIENHEKIISHVEKLNEFKKIHYYRRIEPIISYLKTLI